MTQTAQLGADDLVFPGCHRGEMDTQIQAGHEILLDPQLTDIERMAHILGMHQELNLSVCRNGQLRANNVVFGIWIGGSIETEEVLICLVDLLGMARAELPITSGVAEI